MGRASAEEHHRDGEEGRVCAAAIDFSPGMVTLARSEAAHSGAAQVAHHGHLVQPLFQQARNVCGSASGERGRPVRPHKGRELLLRHRHVVGQFLGRLRHDVHN